MTAGAYRRVVSLLTVVTATTLAGCESFIDPSNAAPPPDNPGQVIVEVHDERGDPVPDVQACVEMPNHVGGLFNTCMATNRRGRAPFTFVAAGLRHVQVWPPPGFSARPDDLEREVTVVTHETTHADFQLIKNR